MNAWREPFIRRWLPLAAITEKSERIVGTAQGELVDVLRLVGFLLRPALLEQLENLIDDAADECAPLGRRIAP